MLTKIDKINKSIPVPLYFQLKELILSEIKNGNYKSGDPIPTEKEISDAFKISRTTVRQAITELVQEGWLYRVKSKGTFVTQPKIPQEFIRRIESFNDQMQRLGMVPSTEVLELKKMSAAEAGEIVMNSLALKKDDAVVFLHRKRMADGEPFVIVKTYMPYSLCHCVFEHDLEKEKLYSILGEEDVTRVFRIERTVEAAEAVGEDVKLLELKKGKPVLYFKSIGYNVYDQPVEYSLSRYRGDRSKFDVTVFPELR